MTKHEPGKMLFCLEKMCSLIINKEDDETKQKLYLLFSEFFPSTFQEAKACWEAYLYMQDNLKKSIH